MRSGKLRLQTILMLSIIPLLGFSQNKEESEDWKAMEPYIGYWESEVKEREDKQFIFTYDLSYYDKAKSIVKMTITQKYLNGESKGEEIILWEGFKGWNPAEGEVYYYGFSPGGRVGLGTGAVEGEKYVWNYYGFGKNGSKVLIKDEFTPVENDAFVSITRIKMEGQDWREVNKDSWTRVN